MCDRVFLYLCVVVCVCVVCGMCICVWCEICMYMWCVEGVCVGCGVGGQCGCVWCVCGVTGVSMVCIWHVCMCGVMCVLCVWYMCMLVGLLHFPPSDLCSQSSPPLVGRGCDTFQLRRADFCRHLSRSSEHCVLTKLLLPKRESFMHLQLYLPHSRQICPLFQSSSCLSVPFHSHCCPAARPRSPSHGPLQGPQPLLASTVPSALDKLSACEQAFPVFRALWAGLLVFYPSLPFCLLCCPCPSWLLGYRPHLGEAGKPGD